MKKVKKNFISRYNRKMFIIFIIVASISMSLSLIQIREIIENNNIIIIEDVRSRTIAIDNFISNITSHLNLMQIKAEYFFTGIESIGSNKLLEFITINDDIYNLDNIPDQYRVNAGNIIGKGKFIDFNRSLKNEIEMALSLNPLFRSTKHNIKKSNWIYYSSVNNFTNNYPWVNSDKIHFNNESQSKFLMEVKEKFKENPKLENFLYGPYLDEFGQGFMFTVLNPIYRENKFIGIVAIDITLNNLTGYLAEYINNFNNTKGMFLIVNEKDQVIACPNLSFEKIYELKDVIPDELQKNKENLLTGDPLEILKKYSYLYVWNRIENTPWRIVFISEKGYHFKMILSKIGTVFFILLTALLIIIVYTKKIIFEEFISPAEKLVRYIEKETKNEERIIPDVPEYWINWFIRISELSESQRKLLVMENELNIAKDIQLRSLPRNFSFSPEKKIELHADMFPAREVGGDLYDFFLIDEKHICIAIGDVVGKGVPASLTMTIAKKLISSIVLQKGGQLSPSEIAGHINEILSFNNPDSYYATLFLGILDVTDGELRYVNCGHAPQPLFTNSGNAPFFRKEVSGPPVGAMPGSSYKEFAAVLPPGEAILLCTDGVTEAMNEEEQLFGDERLLKSFAKMQDKPCKEVIDDILHEVRAYAGQAPQSDDITMLMIRWGAENKNADVAREQQQQGA